ncbi:hypothetical protein PVK06_033735 [Gossypium arboreum]|uniref:Gag-pol polyprotein n=1 Tax=Gossypium arboreum TaxID=29729 RepID=A0ABR0NC89_GOSAR|nr:hypothetical protein PVK06_033735 [Gossypium arboreum]
MDPSIDSPSVNASLLSYIIPTKSTFDIWSTKGGSTIKEYVSKIQTLCALLESSGSSVSVAEKVEVLLAGLPFEFDLIFMLVSISSESLQFKKLVDLLMGFETRLMQAICEIPMVANVEEASSIIDSNLRGAREGQFLSGLRGGRGFRSRVQCQICSRFGHVAQRCYYHFDRYYGSHIDGTPVAGRDGYGRSRGFAPEQRIEGRSWGPPYRME